MKRANAFEASSPLAEPTVFQEIMSWVRSFIAVMAILLPLNMFVIQPIRVEMTSMVPTLLNGEYTAAYKLHLKLGGSPVRGQIVICQFPEVSDYYVKRVIGLPGETMEIRDGIVYINGRPLEEPYIEFPSYETMTIGQLGPDEYFLMGDNRAGSNDSRNPELGPIRRAGLVAEVKAVLWPPTRWHVTPSARY